MLKELKMLYYIYWRNKIVDNLKIVTVGYIFSYIVNMYLAVQLVQEVL